MSQSGGGIYAENSNSFLLENSIFSNLCSAMIGGAVYLLYQDSQHMCKCTLPIITIYSKCIRKLSSKLLI